MIQNNRTARNKKGIMVVKRCASCLFKRLLTDDTLRLCTLKEHLVTPHHFCEHWTMSRALEQVGETEGKVKSRDYLLFLLQVREKEAKQEKRKPGSVTPKTIEEVRMAWKKRRYRKKLNE